MANTSYPKGAQKLLGAAVNLLTDTIKAALVPSAYTFSTAHEFVSDLGARVGTDQALTNKTITGGVLDADNPDFGALAPGNTVKAFVIYKDTGNTSTSPLLFYFDTAVGLPFSTNGGGLVIPWDNGVKKIARLNPPVYPKGGEKMLSGAVNFLTDTLALVALPTSYVYDPAHEFLSGLGALVGTAVTLTNKTITGGVFDADDVDLGAIASGSNIGSLAIIKDTGTAGTSPVLLHLTDVTGFPMATSGSAISVRWSNGSAKIFSLVA